MNPKKTTVPVTVTPYEFGAIEQDPTTTANLQAFFDYVRDNDVIGDFRGIWHVNAGIVIDGDEKKYICGTIDSLNDAGIETLIDIRTGNSVFEGEFYIIGTTAATYSARNIKTGFNFENTGSRNSFEYLHMVGFYQYGAKIYDTGGGSNIMSQIKKIKLTGCGSTGSAYPTGSASAEVFNVVNTGSTGSSAQRSVITVDTVDDGWEEDELIEINSKAHIIKEISGNDITVYPWVDDSFTGTIYGLHGGLIVAGSNSASISIGNIDAIRCGSNARLGGLYGTEVGAVQSQFCGIGLSIGNKESNNNLGSDIRGLYCENNTFDFVQVTRASTNTRIHSVTSNFDKWFVIDAQNTSFEPAGGNKAKVVLTDNQVTFESKDTEKPYGLTGSTTKLSNSPVNNKLDHLRNINTLELKWHGVINGLFGKQVIDISLWGTGGNGQPTGATTFTLDSDDQTAGITVMGGTSYVIPAGATEPLNIKCFFDIGNQNWIISH